MKHANRSRRFIILAAALVALIVLPLTASANHSWGNYHWARTSNPFTLKVGDNVSSAWDPYLVTASSDWNQSTVLKTTIVAGGTRPKNCRPTSGRIEVCNANYGNTGWLGIAQIWVSGGHITQGIAKMNDTYFNTAQYNTPAWRRLVMCQEIAHDFGLDHQDENFNNANLGSCMDYTSDPDGPPSNEHPNQHDYDQLVTIYSHLDSTTTVGAMPAGMANGEFHSQADWGQAISTSDHGKPLLFERDFGNGYKVFTFVYWAE